MNNERAMASIECIAETLLHYRPLLTFTRKTGDDLAYRIVLICFAGSLDLFAQKFTWNYWFILTLNLSSSYWLKG
jgi:hypothetical protein